MRNLTLLLLFLLAGMVARSQRYYMYLQSEGGSPFYVKLGEDVHSSGPAGYLLLPRLTDSTYQLSIGLVSSAGESRFSLPIQSRDWGWLLRSDAASLTLRNLQTGEELRPVVDAAGGGLSFRRRADEFTLLLAKAAFDTSLLYVPVVNEVVAAVPDTPKEKAPEPEVKAVVDSAAVTLTASTAVVTDSVATLQTQTQVSVDSTHRTLATPPADTVAAVVTNPVELKIDSLASGVDTVAVQSKAVGNEVADTVLASAISYQKSKVKRWSESSTSEGFGLVFFDEHSGGIDTIRILIPNPKFQLFQTEPKRGEEANDILLRINRDSLQRVNDSLKAASTVKPCKAATESDFLKARRAMAAEETEDGMIQVALRHLEEACFSTEQIKNLGVLFLTQEGRLKFFEKARPLVADPVAYPSLEAEFRDEEYIKRFRALFGV